jgi:hypothetical protein
MKFASTKQRRLDTAAHPAGNRSNLRFGARLAVAAGIAALSACGGGGSDGDSAATASAPTAHALSAAGEAGGAALQGNLPATLPTTPPVPGVLVYESFGNGPSAAAQSRPTGTKGLPGVVSGSALDSFWAEYPGSKHAAWITPATGTGGPTWGFATGTLSTPDSYSIYTALDPEAGVSGFALSPWLPAFGARRPTALLPFDAPATPYEVWIDGISLAPEPAGSTLAVGLTRSAAASNNLETSGDAWLSLRKDQAGSFVPFSYELRLDGRSGPLLASGSLPAGSGFNQLRLRYDPVGRRLSASVNGVSLGDFPVALASPRYAGFEGYGAVNNFMVRSAP